MATSVAYGTADRRLRLSAMTTERMRVGVVLPIGEDDATGGSRTTRRSGRRGRGRGGAGSTPSGCSTTCSTGSMARRPASTSAGRSCPRIAEATSRVELGTIVMCTAFRNPALLAKMAATLDHVSGGRLILGVGAGWHEPEFDAFGFPFDHRVGRFEESLAVITALDPRGPGGPRRGVGHGPRRRPAAAGPARHADPGRRQEAADARADRAARRCLERWPGSGCPMSGWRAGAAISPRPASAWVAIRPRWRSRSGSIVRYPDAAGASAEPPTTPGLTGTAAEIAAGLRAHADGGRRPR